MMGLDIASVVISAVTVALSVAGAWVVVKEDLARIEQRLVNVENAEKRSTEVNEKLTEALHDLKVTLAELSVEMRHLKERK